MATRILHFITSLKIGGAEGALYNLLEHWGAQDEHCVLYIYNGPYVEKIKALGVPLYKLEGLISPYDPIA